MTSTTQRTRLKLANLAAVVALIMHPSPEDKHRHAQAHVEGKFFRIRLRPHIISVQISQTNTHACPPTLAQARAQVHALLVIIPRLRTHASNIRKSPNGMKIVDARHVDIPHKLQHSPVHRTCMASQNMRGVKTRSARVCPALSPSSPDAHQASTPNHKCEDQGHLPRLDRSAISTDHGERTALTARLPLRASRKYHQT